ncbi:MAG: hypothetical protein HKN87_11795 [Saprospiraceae bacterium]|nr:hypothetical protein [Saprospiraceae bacterium]
MTAVDPAEMISNWTKTNCVFNQPAKETVLLQDGSQLNGKMHLDPCWTPVLSNIVSMGFSSLVLPTLMILFPYAQAL